MGLAPLGPLEGGPEQVSKERVGTVGTAFELGVRLGADPERVLAQLDELTNCPSGELPEHTRPAASSLPL